MREIYKYFSISKEYSNSSEIDFPPNSILFYSSGDEERSTLFASAMPLKNDVERVYIDELIDQRVVLKSTSYNSTLSLRSQNDLNRVVKDFNGRPAFIDITGLTHSVWAWLVRAMLQRDGGDFWVIYSEPVDYKFQDSPFSIQLFDLSERINGIAPLPSFASLIHYTSENSMFMPLLGFEGARLAHIFEDIQPSKRLTFPVIGVPGFKFDYPFFAYQANKATLEREGIWKNWRYEQANCPASIFIIGSDLLKDFPDKYLRIALIGTKPHALGAVLLKLAFPEKVDLIYDHPLRKKGRTSGKSKLLSYYLTPFKTILSK